MDQTKRKPTWVHLIHILLCHYLGLSSCSEWVWWTGGWWGGRRVLLTYACSWTFRTSTFEYVYGGNLFLNEAPQSNPSSMWQRNSGQHDFWPHSDRQQAGRRKRQESEAASKKDRPPPFAWLAFYSCLGFCSSYCQDWPLFYLCWTWSAGKLINYCPSD